MSRYWLIVAIISPSLLGPAHSQPKKDPILKLLPKPVEVSVTSISAYSADTQYVIFSNDGTRLLTFGNHRKEEEPVAVWDLVRKERLRTVRAGGTNLEQFLPTDTAIACLFQKLDGFEIARFDIKSGNRSVLYVSKRIEQPIALWSDRSTAVLASPIRDHRYLRFVDYDKKEDTLLEIDEAFHVLGFSQDKKLVALRFAAGNIKILDWAKKKKVSEFVAAANVMENEKIAHWFITSDSKFAYIGIDGFSPRIEKWDLEKGKLVTTFKDFLLQLVCVKGSPAVLTPDDAYLVTPTTVVNLKTGKVGLYVLKGLRVPGGTALAITPDGRTCAMGQGDGTVHLFATPKVE